MKKYADEIDLIDAVLVKLMARHDTTQDEDAAAAIGLLGAARDVLEPNPHTHGCQQCGHEWTCTEDEDDCDLTCPKCGKDSVVL